MEQQEILVRSTLDGTMQPNLFYASDSPEKRPLLVGLHSWSHNRFNQIKNMLPYAEKYDFNLLLPDFRGKNLPSNEDCTKACGSEYAKQDIKDAIDYLIERNLVDPENIFILGFSGGGQMALLMAGMIPEYFKAVGAAVPVTDLEQFEKEVTVEKYRSSLLQCCSNSVEEMRKRSPITYADTIAKANVKIFHGKFDPLVSLTHSLRLFHTILERHPEARVFLDVFDGGHQIDMKLAMHWIYSQYKQLKNTDVTG